MSNLSLTLLGKLAKSRVAQSLLTVLLMLLPTTVVRPLANAMGHNIAPRARIGFSWLQCEQLALGETSRVGHLNVLLVRRLVLRHGARIIHMNICRGPVSLRLGNGACLGNRNTITRAPKGVTFGPAQLSLGEGSKITAGHSLDCAQSIRFGDYSTLGGKNSQIWTHGYVHYEAPKRYRVDGSIGIGNNVYLGSGVIVTGGLTICDDASVGVGACVTKSLTEPGFYVSSALRMLQKPPDPKTRSDMEQVSGTDLIETVYKKRDGLP